MIESHTRLFSTNLGIELEMETYGHWGYPVLAFPTSLGRYSQNKDFKLVASAAAFIDSGKIKLYCIDSIDTLSFYNESMHPSQRIHNYVLYDKFLNEELVPKIMEECNSQHIAVAGCSFGGYHAANFAFKHPEKTKYLISMGGAFDIKPRLNGFYNDEVFFNNPPDFLTDASDENLWNMKIVLGTSDLDFCKEANISLAHILQQKNIPYWLDIRNGLTHDWPAWCKMFPDYLAMMEE
jgi:esterase/lipase superfamily enzyme